MRLSLQTDIGPYGLTTAFGLHSTANQKRILKFENGNYRNTGKH